MALTKVSTAMYGGDPVDVKDFGAVGDGVANDRQAFLDAMAASSVVYVPAGTYLISGGEIGWTSVNDVTLFGDGWESKIVRSDAGNVIKITSCSRVTVRNLYVQGLFSYVSGTGAINLTSCSFFNISENIVTGSSRQGIKTETCTDGVIANNVVTGAYQDGIMVRSNSRRVSVVGNLSYLNGDPAFGTPIGEGIHIYQSQEITVSGNTCWGNRDHGITLEGADFCSVTGNTSIGNVISGLSAREQVGYSGTGCTVSGNVFAKNGDHGIVISNIPSMSITGNTVSNNSGRGIVVGLSSDPAVIQSNLIISGNAFVDNVSSEVLLDWNTTDCIVSGNTFSSASASIVVNRSTCEDNTISENICRGAGASISDGGTRTRIVRNDLGNKLSGVATLAAGVATITFSPSEPSSAYTVAISGDVNETFYTSNRTINGFEIRSSNASSTATVRWTVVDSKA